jgi:hypothetical protein
MPKREQGPFVIEAIAMSHLVKTPTRASTLLVAEHCAQAGTARAAQRASRAFTYTIHLWVTVIAEIDAHCAMNFATVR